MNARSGPATASRHSPSTLERIVNSSIICPTPLNASSTAASISCNFMTARFWMSGGNRRERAPCQSFSASSLAKLLITRESCLRFNLPSSGSYTRCGYMMKGAALEKLLGIRSAACVPWLLPLNPGADCQFLFYLSDPFIP